MQPKNNRWAIKGYNCLTKGNSLIRITRFTQDEVSEQTLMKTFNAKVEDIKRDWFIIDAENMVLGRLAVEVARRLRGKHKPEYTPHVDTGDCIIVINAEKVRVTGRKSQDKLYHDHTGYPGGIKTTNFDKLQAKMPARVIEKAVKGMLPKGPLGRAMFRKLKVYAGQTHNHSAQQPIPLKLA
ncbi:MAG: hypothetical protein RIT27_999 [Pseudomonadota bacterium]|jgi:large subunit ribosomal protein L13